MFYISESQLLFWGGIGKMSGTAVLAAVCLIIFTVTGKKLKKKLEQEYGRPQDM